MDKVTTTRLISLISAETGQSMAEVEKMLGGLTRVMANAFFKEQVVEFTGIISIIPEAKIGKTSWKFGKLHETKDRIHFSVLKSRHLDEKYRESLAPKNKYLF